MPEGTATTVDDPMNRFEWETVRECPFDDCDWTHERPKSFNASEADEAELDRKAERHYEREHTGEIKLRAMFTKTIKATSHNDAQELSDQLHDDLLGDRPEGMELAFTAGEVVEEADEHPGDSDE